VRRDWETAPSHRQRVKHRENEVFCSREVVLAETPAWKISPKRSNFHPPPRGRHFPCLLPRQMDEPPLIPACEQILADLLRDVSPPLSHTQRKAVARLLEAMQRLQAILDCPKQKCPFLEDQKPIPPLTKRECQVLWQISWGRTNDQVGSDLFVSSLTVKPTSKPSAAKSASKPAAPPPAGSSPKCSPPTPSSSPHWETSAANSTRSESCPCGPDY